MAFQVTEYKFGDQRGLMITCSQSKHHIDLLPGYGASLARIELFGLPIVEPIDNFKQLKEDHWYRNFWLLPFQNRIKDGKYHFEGNDYQLAVNEKDRNNALHGFFQKIKPIDVSWDVQDEVVSVDVSHSYQGQFEGYPFPFTTKFNYQIFAEGKIEISFEVCNTGKVNMPFSIAFHPYFQLDGKRESWKLLHGKLINFPLDERNLPIGNSKILESNLNTSKSDYDHCFRYAEEPYQIAIESDKYLLKMQHGENMPFLQVFTPPRNSIALEPLSSGVDAFNTKENLTVIPPNEIFKGTVSVSLVIK